MLFKFKKMFFVFFGLLIFSLTFFSQSVFAESFFIKTTYLKNGVKNEPYIQTLSVAGAGGHVKYEILSGTLPPGNPAITVADNLISGIPTTLGKYTFTLVAKYVDVNENTITSPPKTFTITIVNSLSEKEETPEVVVTKTACSDGLDNDSDGNIDLLDADCDNSNDNDESESPTLNINQIINNVNGGEVLPEIVDQGKKSFNHTENIFKNYFNFIKNSLNTSTGNILTKIIEVTGIFFQGVFIVTGILFSNPLSFSELILTPARFWSLLMVSLGLKKRTRPWGTVYDSVTKFPIDPALVFLYDLNGNKIAESITDLDGRFGFFVPAGAYKIVAKKTNYTFPSVRLGGRPRDEIYMDIYYGTEIFVGSEGQVITKNIPLDPENFDWNEFAKNKQGLMKFYSERNRIMVKISDFLFDIGFFVTVVGLIVNQSAFNIIFFSMYMIVLLLKEIGIKERPWGRVFNKNDGNPISFGVLKIIHKGIQDIEVGKKVLDRIGRYYALVPKGNYVVSIERKKEDETYEKVFESQVIEVKKGVLNQNFEI